MVTGPMPRKPKATRPKAKIGAAKANFAGMSAIKRRVLREVVGGEHQQHDDRPIQKAEKLPATKPERMFSEAPPCLEQLVTSLTCRELVLTKILVNSGINAPATVPQLMMTESTHQRFGCGVPAASCEIAQQEFAGDEGDDDGDGRGDPDQVGQRRFKVEVLLAAEHGLADGFVDEVGDQRGHDHQRAHDEQPDDERRANVRAGRQRQGQEGDQRHAGHAVGLETVRRRADASRRRCRRCSRR